MQHNSSRPVNTLQRAQLVEWWWECENDDNPKSCHTHYLLRQTLLAVETGAKLKIRSDSRVFLCELWCVSEPVGVCLQWVRLFVDCCVLRLIWTHSSRDKIIRRPKQRRGRIYRLTILINIFFSKWVLNKFSVYICWSDSKVSRWFNLVKATFAFFFFFFKSLKHVFPLTWSSIYASQ